MRRAQEGISRLRRGSYSVCQSRNYLFGLRSRHDYIFYGTVSSFHEDIISRFIGECESVIILLYVLEQSTTKKTPSRLPSSKHHRNSRWLRTSRTIRNSSAMEILKFSHISSIRRAHCHPMLLSIQRYRQIFTSTTAKYCYDESP